jgi:hypothetical protein
MRNEGLPGNVSSIMRRMLIPVLLTVSAHAAGLTGSTPVEQGYQQMYNLDFAGAHRSFDEWQRSHPQDPIGPVSDAAACLFSEFDRLHILQSQFFVEDSAFRGMKKPEADPAIRRKFEDDLAKGQRLSDAILRRAPQDKDAMFASVLRNGLRSDYLSLIEDRNFQALSELKSGRMLAEKLLALDPTYYDAYLAVGVENYMLSLKPMPARWLLRLTGAQTDKDRGIEKVKLAAQNGHYLQPFARLMLAVQNLRDKNRAAAKEILAGLAREFPGNKLYAAELAKLH